MRRISLPCLLAVVFCSVPARAQYGYTGHAAQAGQPTQGLARINLEGKLEVLELVTKPVYETRQATREVTVYQEETRTKLEKRVQDGQEVEVPVEYTVKVPRTETKTYQYQISKLVTAEAQHLFTRNAGSDAFVREDDQAAVKCFETSGKVADPAELNERLKEWTLTLLTHDGKMAPAYYTYWFRPGTLIIALPQPAVHYPMPQVQPVAPPPPPAEGVPVPQPAPSALRQQSNARSIRFAAFQQEPADSHFPKTGLPPILQLAMVDQDKIRLRTFLESKVEQTGYLGGETSTGDDAREARPVQMEYIVWINHVWRIPLEHITASTGNGQVVAAEVLASRLTREIAVLVSQDGKPVNPFWIRNLKPQTLVLVPPSLHVQEGTEAPAPAPMPPSDSPPST